MSAEGSFDLVSGRLRVDAEGVVLSGWACSDGAPARYVVLLLDGEPLAVATVAAARPDVVAHFEDPNLLLSGFVYEIDSSTIARKVAPGWERGELALLVIGRDESLSRPVATVPISADLRADATRVAGYFDSLHAGDIVAAGPMRVIGWAVSDGRPADAVIVTADGEPVASVTPRLDRPDVAEHLGSARTLACGFDIQIELDAGDRVFGHDIELAMLVVDRQAGTLTEGVGACRVRFGEQLTLPGHRMSDALRERLRYRLDPRSPLEGALNGPGEDDGPLPRGALYYYGWALSDAAPIATVEATIGRLAPNRARIAVPRPDITRVRPGPDALIAGFEGLVDLSTLPAELSQVEISISATDAAGNSSVIARRNFPVAPHRQALGTEADAVRRQERLGRLRDDAFDTARSVPAPLSDELNLLVVTNELSYGGSQLLLCDFLRLSGAGRDYPCTVVAQRGGPLALEFERLGVRVHVSTWFPVDDADAYEGRLLELAMLVRSWGCNAVFANTVTSFPGADIADRLGLPCLMAIHESYSPSHFWAENYPADGVDPSVRARAEAAIHKANMVIFESSATRTQYLGILEADRAQVLHYGIEARAIEEFCRTTPKEAARASFGFVPSDRVLLVMGTTERRKSQAMIAQAFGQLAGDYPDARLVFVGANGTDYDAGFQAYVKALDLGSAIRVLPVTKEIYPWYRAADALVSASDIESLPRSMLEAMAFGLPVVMASVFGIPEVIDHGRTGLLFEARNEVAMVSALQQVLSRSSTELGAMGAAGREVVHSGHNAATYAATITELLVNLVTVGVDNRGKLPG